MKKTRHAPPATCHHQGPTVTAIRGLMVDCARLIERHDFYFELLPFMQRWGYNTLWWHFSDDQGFVLKLDRHPELATAHAFSKAEMRRLIAAARDHGIEVVPEVESLGHARYITRLPRYRHLADGDTAAFNAVCPSHPDTLPLLADIIEEVAELFASPYFHAGLDEVNVAGCRRCEARRRGKPETWLYTQHVEAIHKVVTGCGKRMIMWADHVEKAPSMLETLPKDIVMAHWHYQTVPVDRIQRSVTAGFDTLCVPAFCHWGNVIQPNAGNLGNMETMATVPAQLRGRAPLGAVTAWWTAWRGIRGSYLLDAAYAGRLMATGRPGNRARFARTFAADHFGLKETAAAEALLRLHDVAVNATELNAMLFDSWADIVELVGLARADAWTQRLQTASDCVSALAQATPGVKRHQDDYSACLLAARLAEMGLDHGRLMIEFTTHCRQVQHLRDQGRPPRAVLDFLRQAIGVMEGLQARLDRLCREAGADWNRTRYPDDPIRGSRDRATTPSQRDMLLGRMLRCRDYVATLLRDLKARLKSKDSSRLVP